LVIGVGRSSQAAAAAMQIARGMTGDGGSEWGLGWVGLTDPDPSWLS
jgi:hypothetical protein